MSQAKKFKGNVKIQSSLESDPTPTLCDDKLAFDKLTDCTSDSYILKKKMKTATHYTREAILPMKCHIESDTPKITTCPWILFNPDTDHPKGHRDPTSQGIHL